MAGITDLPFRRLAWRLGAGLVVSEMTSARPDLRATAESAQRMALDPEATPRVVQIAGADPAMLANAARAAVAHGAQVVDINMGCPAKKVCRQAAGSALLRDEALVARILGAVVAAVDVPVTLKMRTGWSPAERNAVRIARLAEDCGVAALALHGRTRACRFRGPAEYRTIAEVVGAVRIPVLANGDIDSPGKAAAVLAETGAAGVMIGRAALGQPWLPGFVARRLDGETCTALAGDLARRIAREHLVALHHFYGPERGVRIARKHIGAYLALHGEPTQRREFNSAVTAERQIEVLDSAVRSERAAA